MGADDGLATIHFTSAAEWEAWLEENHAAGDGVWIKIAKKGSGIESVTLEEALQDALCFGWIDGRRERLDENYYLQRYQPRRRRSPWSKLNRERAERLIAEKRMRAAGLAEIERAKDDGRWEAAYESPRTMAVPEDLERELGSRPEAKEFFAALSSRNRYAILYGLHDAKRPETRARRLAKFVAMLEAGETHYP